jgi:two-component system, sensor histidine kinase ChiS
VKPRNILLICIILFYSNVYSYVYCNPPRVENGVLDLSHTPPDQIVKLDGEWKFIFNTTPQGIFKPDFNDADLETFRVPGYWDSRGGPFGYAWFRCRIILPGDHHDYTLYFKSYHTALKLYLNGTAYHEYGKAGDSREESIPYKTDFIAGLPETDEIIIVMKIANFHDVHGGLLDSIIIGNLTKIHREIWIENLRINILIGILALGFLFHIILWISRRSEKYLLFFSLFCLSLALWITTQTHIIQKIVYSQSIFQIETKIEIISVILSCIFAALFLRPFLKTLIKKWMFYILGSITILFVIIITFTPTWIFTRLEPFQHIYIVSVNVWLFISIFIAAVKQHEYAIFLFIGFFTLSMTVMNDVLYFNNIINTTILVPFGMSVFIIIQSIVISLHFSRLEKEKEHLRLTQIIEKKEKWASIGRLISGLAHDILNPLSGIKGPFDLLTAHMEKEALLSNSDIREAITHVKANLKRIESITTILKSLRIENVEKKEKIEFAPFIDTLFDLFKDKMTDKITITNNVPRDMILYCNPHALRHIFINLIGNALDAIQNKGDVCIDATRGEVYDRIFIKDTGSGIRKDNLYHIFDLYFSTKEFGYSTGLGLYFVKDLILRMNWDITVDSTEGQGTTFTIHIRKEKI